MNEIAQFIGYMAVGYYACQLIYRFSGMKARDEARRARHAERANCWSMMQ